MVFRVLPLEPHFEMRGQSGARRRLTGVRGPLRLLAEGGCKGL